MKTEFENYIGENNWINAIVTVVLALAIVMIVSEIFGLMAGRTSCEAEGTCDEMITIEGLE